MVSHRIEKVSAQILREISLLLNQDFSESFGIIAANDIDITADFKEAKIFISIFDKNKEPDILKKLEEKASEYQHVLGKKLKIKFTPRLEFKIDQSQEKINRVDELLKEIDHGT